MCRVLYLSASSPGQGGGIAKYDADLQHAISDAEGAHLNIVFMPEGRWRIMNFVRNALVDFYSFKPDVVVCGHIYFLALAVCLGILSSRCRIWLQIHGIEAWWARKLFSRVLTERVALVTAVSRYTRQRFLDWTQLPGYRVRVLPNTIAYPEKVDRTMLPAQLFEIVSRPGPLLVTVARIDSREQYKGHDRVIKCLPELIKDYPDITYLIVGEGDDGGRLRELAKERKVLNSVCFLSGADDNTRNWIYESMDLFVMPSTGEGFGIAFLEAMIHDRMALGFGEDGSVDPLGGLGVVSDDKNLASDIERALKTEATGNLSERVIDRFSIEKFKVHVAQLLGELCVD